MAIAARDFAELVSASDVLIVCGSGGVGKTSTSAAIAVQAAVESRRRVLVMTVDPARRLADALRVKALGNEVTAVPAEALTVDGVAPQGQLFAAMLDAKQSWDQLVNRHAPDEATKAQIMSNPLYKSITERFVQSHDYIAMERLYELRQSGEYDLIVIDTPPANHAIDFLEAPKRMADFFDSRVLKFLIAPAKSKIMQFTARPFLQIADRVLGARFLSDITDFFIALDTMRPGFIARANSVEALLKQARTNFVVVTTLEPAPRNEAARFIEELENRSLNLGGMVFNRVLPDFLVSDEGTRAAEDMTARAEDLATRLSVNEEADSKVDARVIRAAVANYLRFFTLAAAERSELAKLAHKPQVTATVPWFETETSDIGGLLRAGAYLWK